jgi:Na+-translocating ferredoxin:NAD+ oxidoreductase subunit A
LTYIGIILVWTLVSNVVFSQLLGVCSFSCETGNPARKAGIGLAIAFMASFTAAAVWTVNRWVLVPLSAGILLLPSVIIIAAGMTALIKSTATFLAPKSAASLDDAFSLLFVDCVVVAVSLSVIKADYGLFESLVAGLAAGAGFSLASFLLSSVRQRLDIGDVPEAFRGAPIMLITAGLMALAFMAFDRSFLSGVVG